MKPSAAARVRVLSAGYLTAINIASWFINQGSRCRRDGGIFRDHAGLCDARKLLQGPSDGRVRMRSGRRSTEENAWDFYYNYVTLWNLRYAGEKAYLDMNKMDGLLAFLAAKASIR